MHIRRSCILVVVAGACTAVLGQTPGTDSAVARARLAAQPQPAPTGDAAARRERLLKATQLPRKAEEVRAKGTPAPEMKEALEAARAKRVPAGEMADVTDAHSKGIDEHGRIDNFGAFVKSKLNEGLRGRELAAAIRAEHARRGMGKPPKGEKAKGEKNEKGEKGAKHDDDDQKGKHDEDRAPRDRPEERGGGKGKPHGKP